MVMTETAVVAVKKTTALSLSDANAKLEYYVKTLFLNNVRFSIFNRTEAKLIQIISKSDAMKMKALLPTATLDLDSTSTYVAEIVIHYA